MGLANLQNPEPSLTAGDWVAIGVGAIVIAGFIGVIAYLSAAFNNAFNSAATKLDLAGNVSQAAGAAGGQSPNGAGQVIGIPSFSNFQPGDVADWLAVAGLPANLINQVSKVDVNGGAPLLQGESDVLLSIDTILAIAPGAQVMVFDAPFAGPGTSFQALFNAMINGGVTIISNSFSYCEDQTTPADVQSIDSILQMAAASGITVLNATGDSRQYLQ